MDGQQKVPVIWINKRRVLIGIVFLLVGAMVYLVARPPDRTYFIYKIGLNIGCYNTLPNFFGFVGSFLPAFIHVFSFILITGGIISCCKRGCLVICLSWFLVDSIFELGQKFPALPIKMIPAWFSKIPILENTENFFLTGTFDYLDMAAISIGALFAYLALLQTMGRRVQK